MTLIDTDDQLEDGPDPERPVLPETTVPGADVPTPLAGNPPETPASPTPVIAPPQAPGAGAVPASVTLSFTVPKLTNLSMDQTRDRLRSIARATPLEVWLCLAGSVLFWLTSLGRWVDLGSVGLGFFTITYTGLALNGGSNFFFGFLGAFVVFLGFALWLAIAKQVIPVQIKSLRTMPRAVPLAVAIYACCGLFLAWTSYSSYGTMTGLWFLALLCAGVLLGGAVLYWRKDAATAPRPAVTVNPPAASAPQGE